MRNSQHSGILVFIAISLGCLMSNVISAQISFTEAFADFARVEKNLRKWDSPVVADLDQDGFPDLVLNDHGLGISICWNNQGRFAKPYDLIMGDLHGVTVGDYDFDGNLEIALSRGGGSGSNARNSKIFRVDRTRKFTEVPDFNTPLALMRGRTLKFLDADNDGDLDLLNFAFPDKEKKGESENYIYENDGNGQLLHHSVIPASKANGQKTLVTDVDGDNIIDLLIYGEGSIKCYLGNGDLTFKDNTKRAFPKAIFDVTGMVEIDYDNDGDFDIFLTRGKEFEIGETFFDPERKTWGFFTKRGAFKFEDLVVGHVLQIENFQSQWPDNDAYFIGETGYPYEFAGETHSGKDIRLVSSDALGYLDNCSNTGFYIGYVGNNSWRISGSLWAPATGIVHGVMSYPAYNHKPGLNDILLENHNGKFRDVTKEAGLSYDEHNTGVCTADINNDGFQDLVIMRRGELIHENYALIYLNQGDKRFKQIENHNMVSSELGAIGMGVEPIDYNLDGKVDVVIGNERGKWHLFQNTSTGADNGNFLTIEVGNAPQGKSSALGALVTVESCGVKQVRRVGSGGAAYSLGFNHFVHFGLGGCQEPVRIKVLWTNGELEESTFTILNRIVSLGKKSSH